MDRRHGIEEMRRLASAGVDPGDEYLIGRVRVSQANQHPGVDETTDPLGCPVTLWREGDQRDGFLSKPGGEECLVGRLDVLQPMRALLLWREERALDR